MFGHFARDLNWPVQRWRLFLRPAGIGTIAALSMLESNILT